LNLGLLARSCDLFRRRSNKFVHRRHPSSAAEIQSLIPRVCAGNEISTRGDVASSQFVQQVCVVRPTHRRRRVVADAELMFSKSGADFVFRTQSTMSSATTGVCCAWPAAMGLHYACMDVERLVVSSLHPVLRIDLRNALIVGPCHLFSRCHPFN
jgi:hypothetical protein